MSEKTEQATSAARRHIIERPRLTRLLDEAAARVIMLVAPAGYGKTTLARQWLASRPHAWLQASESSSDVVALAVHVSRTLAALGHGTNERLLGRIRAMRDSRQELRSIAELQAQEVQPWPDDTWLAIDDYEYIARSEVAEEYVHLLLDELNVRLLVASRVTPVWATPRALLYGEITEIDRADLAMRRTETRSVLPTVPERSVSEIFEIADGWPALIGLASLTEFDARWADEVSGPVFDYFADELYHRASKSLQVALPQLALAPRITTQLAALVLGPKRGPRLLAEARQIGFFSGPSVDVRLHPLLKRFLLTKLDGRRVDHDALADKMIDFSIERREWDDAFELIHQMRRPAALIRLCDVAYNFMLSSGRTTTLETWLGLAGQLGLASPLFNLIRAELALREGNLSRAERIAGKIAGEAKAEPYRSRAYNVAGRSAHLDDREADALSLFQLAAATARNEDERHEATWGSLLAAHAFDKEEDVLATLAQFLAREPESADDLLRAANARFMVALTIGDIVEAVDFAQEGLAGFEHTHDPVIRTSFLNAFSRSLSLQARYAEGGSFADRLVDEAQRTRLEFVLPHAYVAKAVALIGMRSFADAEGMLSHAEELADQMDDQHNVLDARNVRAKLAITLRQHDRALALIRDLRDAKSVTSTMTAELLGTRGLAQACTGSFDEARASLTQAERLSSVPEVRSLVACARAILRLQRDGDTGAIGELEPAFQLSILDPVIMICRGVPRFGRLLAGHHALPAAIAAEVRSPPIQRRAGSIEGRLTRREAEVLKLISLGYTNREIAGELFIAEVTAKVHVRNIIRKLGVRSRTEAAIAALRENPQ
jgi:LuxR family transcriptional regulator, maltose regulon positive regulatory protein